MRGRGLQIGRLDAAWLHSPRLCRRGRRLRLLLREPQRCRGLGAVGFDLRAQDLALLHRRLNELRQESVVLEPAPCGHCLAEWAYWGHREGPENALAAETVRASERHWVCKGLQADHAAQLAQEFVEAPERVEVCGYSRADRHRAAQPRPSRAGAGLAQRAKRAPRCTGEAFAGVSGAVALALAGRIKLPRGREGPVQSQSTTPPAPRCLHCGRQSFALQSKLVAAMRVFGRSKT